MSCLLSPFGLFFRVIRTDSELIKNYALKIDNEFIVFLGSVSLVGELPELLEKCIGLACVLELLEVLRELLDRFSFDGVV